MADSTIGVSPARRAAQASALSGRLLGTFVPRLIAGLAILLAWEWVVRAFAPAYVAKPTTVVLAIPRVIVDPAFLAATGADAGCGRRRPCHRARRSAPLIGLLMGRSARRRARHPALRQRLLRHADDRRAAAVFAVVRLFRRRAHRHHHLRRDLLHHHQRRRRRALGAARISGGRAFVPLDTAARADRDRAAVVDALSAGRLPPGGRPRADRRGGGGILPLDRRARLFHPL